MNSFEHFTTLGDKNLGIFKNAPSTEKCSCFARTGLISDMKYFQLKIWCDISINYASTIVWYWVPLTNFALMVLGII
jgi:hypothetical protein